MSDPIRVGVLGAGGIAAKLHLPELTAVEGVAVTRIAGRRRHRLEVLQQRFEIPDATDDYEALVHDDGLDALVIATPHPHHVRWARAAIDAGKHVLIQKPLCADRGEADALLEAARRTEKVVFCLPHIGPAGTRAAELTREGAIGRLASLRCRTSHGGPEVYYREVASIFGEAPPEDDLWFFDASRAGGGALFDMGVYAVAQLVAIAGTMRKVRAAAATVAKPADVEDTAAVTMTAENGALAVAETSWCDPGRTWSLSVHGTAAKLEVPSPGVSDETLIRFAPERADSDKAPVQREPIDPGASLGNAHEHFARCVREGRTPPYSHAAAARHVTDILLAAIESAESGAPVATRTSVDD